jgi:hypothetical protein
MCLQKEARKRPTVHTLLNSKFFKIERSVTPLVNELLCHVRNISVEDGPIHDYEDCATPNVLPASNYRSHLMNLT